MDLKPQKRKEWATQSFSNEIKTTRSHLWDQNEIKLTSKNSKKSLIMFKALYLHQVENESQKPNP